MRTESRGGGAPRVLVIAELEDAERALPEQLAARGFAARAVKSAAEGVRAMRRDGADVVVLGLPLAGADPIAVCAALKEGEYPPMLVLGDAGDQAPALADSLPEGLRPDAAVPRPFDPAKLAIAIHECLQADDESSERSAGVSLAELLIELKRQHASEVLELRASGVCTAIYLRDGDPVFAEGGSLQETLGRQLVRRGAIAHEDYVRVVARLTEGVIQHESLRLGEVLVELGMLTPAEVYDALSLQVREKLVACFQWETFAYELHEPPDASEELGIYRCPPTEALVLAGIRAHYGPERLAPLLEAHAGAFPVLRRGLETLVPLFQPSVPEQKLLRAIDGSKSVAALRAARILEPLHVDQVLGALVACCALELRAAPQEHAPRAGAPARPPKPSPHRGVPPPAKPGSAVLRAIPPITARERTFDPLVQLRRRMGIAPSPGAASPKRVRLEAEAAFNHGLRLLRESALPGALREFHRAVELLPAEPEYRLLEAWLEYRSAPAGDARTLGAAKVRACATRVLQASRTSPRAHSILGQLALQEGDDETAERHVRLALRYEYGDVEAQRALRILEKRKRS